MISPEQMKKEVSNILENEKNQILKVQKLMKLAMDVQVHREKEKMENLKNVLVKNINRPPAIKWD